MKTIVVTGAAGFIGSVFAEEMQKRNFNVIAVDKLEYFKSRPEMFRLKNIQTLDRDEFLAKIENGSFEADAVVHMGACSATTELNVEYLTRVNLNYSKSVWNFCTKKKIPLVYASSAATYGEGENGYDDDESKIKNLKPLNPYGESKQNFDIWVLEQEEKGHHPPAWSGFKFFNVYGFGEKHKTKMASVVLHSFDQINENGFVKLFKSHREGIEHGHQKRDFVYVEDVVDVMMFALEKPIKRGIFNLGSGKARTFLDLVNSVFKEMNRIKKIEFIDTPLSIRDRYQYFTEAKMQKIKNEGYQKPFHSLEDGIQKYINKLLKKN